MKQAIILITALVLSLTGFAQFPGGGMPPAQGKGMQAPPSIGIVFGKVVDSAGKPIQDASVILMGSKMDTATKKFKQVMLKAMSTKAAGSFRFEDLPLMGPLTIKISATGYAPFEKQFSIVDPKQMKPGSMPDVEKDFGKISMNIQATEMSTITVVGKKPAMKMDIDKKVFNVEKNIVSTGGTAVDVMKNVPSVNVDIDGNVTLRNASPQIFVDGRPSTLSLDQIPADAIESVEVMTNPSAKYDASGGNAGILNIILKKNKKSGYNGNIMAGVDRRGALNGGGGFNLRQDKFNFSANAFGNQMRMRPTSETYMEDLLYNPSLLVDQYSKTKNAGGFIFGKIGMDYFASDRSTFSVGLIRVRGQMKPTEFMWSDSSFSDGTYKSYSERTTTTNREFNATGFTAGYKYLFPRKGEELTADINMFSANNNSVINYDTYVYGAKGTALTGEQHQRTLGDGNNRFSTIQTDYVRPLKNNGKIEAGLRAQLRNMTNNQENYFSDYSGSFIKVPNSASNYKNKDNVYAAYFSYQGSMKTFGYKLGLRAESSDYSAEMTETGEEFSNNYPLSLFPSLFLSQKLKNNQELQFSVTRRVNRPFFLQQMPFIDSSNQTNWTRGNPALKPEFTYSFEAAYLKTYKGTNTFMASVYFKHTDNLITTILDTVQLSNGNTHPVTTYENANSSYMTGLELTNQHTFNKWWDMNTNVNIYNSKINAENQGVSTEALWSWFAKFNSNFKLPKEFSIQFSGTYQSKTNTPVNQGGGGFGPPMGGGAQSNAQGFIKANYGFDLAVKKNFLKNNAASVTLAVNDIFRTRINHQFTYSEFYNREAIRYPDNPMVRMTFSYRFGKMDMSLFKRKNMKGEAEGMQGGMQMQ
jgi:outer membrane receptor protein involved in Fe transport